MKANDLCALAAAVIKSASDDNAFLDSGKERRWPQAPANDKAPDPVSNIYKSVNNFDLWRHLQKDGGVQLSLCKHGVHSNALVRHVEGELCGLSDPLTHKGKTPENVFLIHRVPIWNSGFSTNGCVLPDIAEAA